MDPTLIPEPGHEVWADLPRYQSWRGGGLHLGPISGLRRYFWGALCCGVVLVLIGVNGVLFKSSSSVASVAPILLPAAGKNSSRSILLKTGKMRVRNVFPASPCRWFYLQAQGSELAIGARAQEKCQSP